MADPSRDPAGGSRETVERAPGRDKPCAESAHPENRAGADKATKDNDLTTGHSRPGDGGDDNAKRKNK